MIASRAKQYVRSGAWYLDRIDPNWHTKVNLDTLNIASAFDCILGQVFGDFALGHRRLLLKNVSVNFSGFVASLHAPAHELEEAWRELIKERLESGV